MEPHSIQSVFARSPVDEDAPVEVLGPFLDFWTFSNSDMKKEIESSKPPARTDRMAMWIRATPHKNAVTVVMNRHMITLRMNGINSIPPPGANICCTKDILFFNYKRYMVTRILLVQLKDQILALIFQKYELVLTNVKTMGTITYYISINCHWAFFLLWKGKSTNPRIPTKIKK